MKNTAILLIRCSDRKGIIAQVTEYVDQHKGNVVYIDQHVDRENKLFFMRVQWELQGFTESLSRCKTSIQQLINDPDATIELYDTNAIPNMAVFVSKASHCLHDLLYHFQSGSWKVNIPLIISNHPEMKEIADRYGIEFHLIPMSSKNKVEQERIQLELLKKHDVKLVVLARYMQILSSDFIRQYGHNIINIHHSMLPAFVGAKPYHQAFERGVKFIGATSHYVTEELDAGPIIEQDIEHVDHRDTVNDLIRKGKELEKVVLSRAVYAHLQRKVLVSGNKTIVFH